MMLNHNPMFPPEFPMPEHPGTLSQQPTLPPTPIIFESEKSEELPLRAYAAILLRSPASIGSTKMIVRSREMDRARPRAPGKRKRK